MLKKYAAFCDVGSNLLLQRMRRYINCNHNKNADTAVASFGAHSLLCFFVVLKTSWDRKQKCYYCCCCYRPVHLLYLFVHFTRLFAQRRTIVIHAAPVALLPLRSALMQFPPAPAAAAKSSSRAFSAYFYFLFFAALTNTVALTLILLFLLLLSSLLYVLIICAAPILLLFSFSLCLFVIRS